MTQTIFVQKRDGSRQEFNIEKIHKVLEWATKDINGVSISEIELRANIQLYDGIPAYDIHELLIKSSAELISEDTPNYQYVAARLVNYKLRKEVYGQHEPFSISHCVDVNVMNGYYSEELKNNYSDDELYQLENVIDHTRDDLFAYAGMEQMRGKYLVKNKKTGQFYETPQILYMTIAMTLFMNEDKQHRLRYIKEFYDMVSQHYISLPTPIMAGCRTPIKNFSSCVLIESDDSLDSICGTSNAIISYVSKKAGIGINAGAIRAKGSFVGKDKSIIHTGIVPFLKYFQASVKSCSQGGVRGGAATVNLPIWHKEFEDLIVLSNNKGTEETRVRHLDYCFHFNKLFYERLLEDGNITLFSPHDVPGLYEAFYADYAEFVRLYENMEQWIDWYERGLKTELELKTKFKGGEINYTRLPAYEVFNQFCTERKETGRVYLMNVDHANDHGSFDPKVAPIKMTNLCVEITLPTKPVSATNPDEGEIALCTLGAINWGMINKPEDFEKPCRILVRALDNLLSYQEYMHPAAKRHTTKYRPLGIGIINLAYFLAKRGLKYDDNALETIDEYAEAWSYYLIQSSIELAEERGYCDYIDDVKYYEGVFPIDTYKRDVDKLVKRKPTYNWSELKNFCYDNGIRNATLMACMPSETSAQVSNATNGIEPPRGLVSYKTSKHGVLPQVVPGIHHLKNKYDLLWDQKTPEGYLKVCAVLQKWMDQSISVNTSYDPRHFEDGEIPISQLIGNVLLAYKYGLKTLYYHNTNDDAEEEKSELPDTLDSDNASGSYQEEDCEACKL